MWQSLGTSPKGREKSGWTVEIIELDQLRNDDTATGSSSGSDTATTLDTTLSTDDRLLARLPGRSRQRYKTGTEFAVCSCVKLQWRL